MRNRRLLFGPLGALILVLGITGLPWLLPHYSSVHQTVSEIGEVGSPAMAPFSVMLLLCAVCMLVFASGLRRACLDSGHSALAAYLVGFFAVTATGLAFNPFPYPLHNVFGLSELVSYLAPFVLAVAWRREPGTPRLAVFVWLMAALMALAVAANLSVLDREGWLWSYEHPVYGLVQRSLFAVWGVWCIGVGLLLPVGRSRAVATDIIP
jgi:hypothetical protein